MGSRRLPLEHVVGRRGARFACGGPVESPVDRRDAPKGTFYGCTNIILLTRLLGCYLQIQAAPLRICSGSTRDSKSEASFQRLYVLTLYPGIRVSVNMGAVALGASPPSAVTGHVIVRHIHHSLSLTLRVLALRSHLIRISGR